MPYKYRFWKGAFMQNETNLSKVSLQELNLLDSFLFSAATENPENAKLIAKIIIRRVLGINTENIQVDAEKQYKGTDIGKKGIRLDIHVREYNKEQLIRIYDIEPNSYKEPHLAKRNRYYLSLTDTKYLGTSSDYDKLPEYFSIWILPYDPFGDNRMIYTVKNMVVENPDLVYNEGVTRIFLYTDGELGGTDEVRTLLRYFSSTSDANAIDSELRSIQSIINDVKNNREVGEKYMTMDEYLDHRLEEMYNARMKIFEKDYEKRIEQAVEERIEQAVEERIEQAVEERVEQAVEEARDENIIKLVQTLKSANIPEEQIISTLIQVHSLTKEEAIKRVHNK